MCGVVSYLQAPCFGRSFGEPLHSTGLHFSILSTHVKVPAVPPGFAYVSALVAALRLGLPADRRPPHRLHL